MKFVLLCSLMVGIIGCTNPPSIVINDYSRFSYNLRLAYYELDSGGSDFSCVYEQQTQPFGLWKIIIQARTDGYRNDPHLGPDPVGSCESLADLKGEKTQFLYLILGGEFAISFDFGRSWKSIGVFPNAPEDFWISAVEINRKGLGIMEVNTYSKNHRFVLTTSDFGLTWKVSP